jgi:hypothetical protein
MKHVSQFSWSVGRKSNKKPFEYGVIVIEFAELFSFLLGYLGKLFLLWGGGGGGCEVHHQDWLSASSR